MRLPQSTHDMTTETIEITGTIANSETPKMQVRVLREKKRGCGYRKAGGTYMVALDPMELDKHGLPVELHVCPTCNAGIKFSRGFQWVNIRELLGHGNAPEKAGLIWIGEGFYPTPQHFLLEAQEQGVSRRLATVPRGLVMGETRIYLAHRKVNVGKGEPKPAVFAWFVPTGLQYIVRPTDGAEKIEALAKRGIETVHVAPEDMLLDVAPSLSPQMRWQQQHGVSVGRDPVTGFYFAQVSATGQRSIDCETGDEAVQDLCARHQIASYEEELLGQAV
jgi:hypothetical protein